MTPSEVPASFERQMGCRAGELVTWLPVALPGATLTVDAIANRAQAHFADGALTLTWRELAPRRIALLEVPQLLVAFRYDGLDGARRYEVQRRFDLATQRGGG